MLIKRPNRLPGQFHKLIFAFDIFHLRIACYYESGCDRCEDQQKARSRCAHWAQLNSTKKSGGFHTLLTPSGRDGFVLYIIVLQNYQKHYQFFTEKVKLRQNLSLEWSKWIFAPRRIFPLLLFVRHTSLYATSLKSSFYWLVIAVPRVLILIKILMWMWSAFASRLLWRLPSAPKWHLVKSSSCSFPDLLLLLQVQQGSGRFGASFAF